MEFRIEQSVMRWRQQLPVTGLATLQHLERCCQQRGLHVLYEEGLPCAIYIHHPEFPHIGVPLHYDEWRRYRALLEEAGHHALSEIVGVRPLTCAPGRRGQRLDVATNGRGEYYCRLWQAAWLLPVEVVYTHEPEQWLHLVGGDRTLLEMRYHALARLAQRDARLEEYLLTLNGRFIH